MRILLTGGGTGGHLFPLLAVIRELKKPEFNQKIIELNPAEGLKILFLGPKTIGEDLLKQEKIQIKHVMSGKLRRYASIKNLIDIFKLPLGIICALWHIFLFMPDVVFSKGGYGSIPAIVTARIYRIPVLIHESDTIPGLANKKMARFAKRIAVSFNSTLKFYPDKKIALIGNPVREQILAGSKEEAKKIFNLPFNKPVILVIGGSQGAAAINKFIAGTILDLTKKYAIIHQCGQNNIADVEKEIKDTFGKEIKNIESYCLIPFLDETQMKHALAAADLVISRAGSGSIFEVAACGKPSILIPLPGSAADHQKENAYEYAKTGAALVLEQANLTPHLLISEISSLLDNPETLIKMSQAAKSFAKLDAAQKIAEELINLAK